MPTHFSDITTLLPLWAGIPGLTRSVDLLEKTIFQPQRFWRPHGLPFIPQFPLDQGSGSSHGVHLIWNMLVGRGLLRYDQRVRAAQLLIRLMTSITANFKQRGAFSQQMHARTGLPDGDENALEGLPPLSFFLEVAGVRVISPWTVELSGFNPMPWPISVRYRGLTVRRYQDRSEVEFPDGHGIAIGDPAPCRVTARQSVIQVEPQQTARRIRVSLPKPFSRWRKK